MDEQQKVEDYLVTDRQIRAWHEQIFDSISVYITGKNVATGKRVVVPQLDFVEVKEDGTAISPTMMLRGDQAQVLMDELWNCGLRPSEGTGSAGSLRATKNHLSDMQKLVWQLLPNILRKENG